jgi:hypothetical protein
VNGRGSADVEWRSFDIERLVEMKNDRRRTAKKKLGNLQVFVDAVIEVSLNQEQ